ncbi:VOC family protein [Kineococcus rhizosphaerae]|uniref:Putative enzyme related to lactoylglutathione lyase n=1 Tax=Kineococcus rhizosphaerae TaxID=559628 RepID=A0A2T0R252_9ACTN|nr:VOC family protein [Kineococcus rhizosphaerae]PRY13610.1 putative enzyme related to lactoylglutathione lyase [Kineococcus rhizosphaerae]
MEALSHVSTVFLFVADLPGAVRWYTDRLGDPPVEEIPQLAVFDTGAGRLVLHVEDEFNTGAGVSGPVAYWDVADVDAVTAAWVAHGALAHRGPKTVFGGQRLCQLLDPFGNLVGIRQVLP